MEKNIDDESVKSGYDDESLIVKRAREKLRKRLWLYDSKVTPQALREKVIEMHRWISKHTADRVSCKKSISLFDENNNAADFSKKIKKVAEKIKDNIY